MQFGSNGWAGLFIKSPTLLLLWHFTRHVVVGVILFIVVGLAALVLKFFNDWLIALEMPHLITDVTHWLELAIFIIDVIGLILVVSSELVILLKEVYNETRQKLASPEGINPTGYKNANQ